ncbi:MAG TPA: nitroreductase/quinone reductase family protein [Acidimicrobiales bacterium]|nr:nitroreductase/quinone reductase family protein [Acidimicrobiales bacterium]
MQRGRILQAVDTNFTNRVFRFLLCHGIASRAFALLETTGRRTGLPRQTPVGNGLEGSTFWLVSMDKGSSYVRNLVADPRVRVKVGRIWYAGTATVVPDDDAMSRRRQLDVANGPVGRFDGIIFRRLARAPLTVRIDLNE